MTKVTVVAISLWHNVSAQTKIQWLRVFHNKSSDYRSQTEQVTTHRYEH
jgi:hypothetical protein